jgi:hypothetical protein
MSALIDAIGGAITNLSSALGIKDVLDNAFRGSEIVVASASFSRLYSIKLHMPVIKQTVISAMLGNRNPISDLKGVIQKSPARNIEEAYRYATGQQSSETYAYSAEYKTAWNAYSQSIITYTNAVNAIKGDIVFTVKSSSGKILRTYTGYTSLLNALNSPDADTKFPTIRTSNGTDNQKQDALNVLAQADAQINALAKPSFNPPSQLGYYYYRLPTIEASGFTIDGVETINNNNTSNFSIEAVGSASSSVYITNSTEAYPIIIIKREGGYADPSSDEYKTTEKLSRLYGFDYDALRKNIMDQDNPDIKSAGVLLGVDLFSNTVAAKKYILEFFDYLLPLGALQPTEEISYSISSEDGSATETTTSINPYIKTSESSINLFMTVETATKDVIGTSDLGLTSSLSRSPTVDVSMTNSSGKYSISAKKYIDDFNYLSIEIRGLTLQTYVATDTSYHGTEMGMYTFNSPVAVATDNTDPFILPLLRAPYLKLNPLDKIDLSRESGFLMVMAAQVTALTWAQTNAGLIQFVAIVFAVFTMGKSLALAGEITTTTAAGVATTTAVYSASAFIVNFAVNVVIILAVRELAAKMFPDSEAAQLAATALTMYYINDYDFSSNDGIDGIFSDRSLIDNMLKYSQAVIDVYNEDLKDRIKKESEEYSANLDALTEEYEENAAKLESLPQLTDLVREDYRDSILLRNKVKPIETADTFYTRTLNTDLAEVATNPTYYYNSKLNLNNIA